MRTRAASGSAKASPLGSSTSMPARRARSAAAPRSAGHVVHAVEEGDREVVGDHDAVEAPLAPQDVGEVARRPGDRLAVDLGVRVHDRPRPAVADRHLERRQQHVVRPRAARVHRRVVATRLRRRVADEVLQRGVHTATPAAPARRRCRSCRRRRGLRRCTRRRGPSAASRMTSSTGARPWWMPSARIDSPISRPISLHQRRGRTRRPRRAGSGRSRPSTRRDR